MGPSLLMETPQGGYTNGRLTSDFRPKGGHFAKYRVDVPPVPESRDRPRSRQAPPARCPVGRNDFRRESVSIRDPRRASRRILISFEHLGKKEVSMRMKSL